MAAGTGVLVTGADGQVGRALRSHLPEARYMGHEQLDVRDRNAVDSALRDTDVVVHLAAMTNVDGCETDPELARSINDVGTRNIAVSAAEHGVRIVYLSTDYVFDGTKTGEYIESDDPAPVNVYGSTKLAGERHVAAQPDNLIVRTSWVFGDGSNFVRKIVSLARERSEIAVVDDQVGRPTAAADLSRALAALIEVGASGVVHAAGAGGHATWADLAEMTVALTGAPAMIRRVTSEEYEAMATRPPAPRPLNSVLSLRLLSDRWSIVMPGWEQSLQAYLGAAA